MLDGAKKKSTSLAKLMIYGKMPGNRSLKTGQIKIRVWLKKTQVEPQIKRKALQFRNTINQS